MAGTGEVRARWIETREWWLKEPQHEIVEYIDSGGVRRLKERDLPTLGVDGPNGQLPYDDDNREEITIRERKVRDPLAPLVNPTEPSIERKKADQAWVKSRGSAEANPQSLVGYAALHVLSGYSFGRSTILAEEIAKGAARGEIPAAAIADRFSLAGAVEHVRACKRLGVKPLVGASIELAEGGDLVLIARSKVGYRSLSRLISACHLGEPRGFPLATWERLEEHAEGLICLTGGEVGPLANLLTRRDKGAAKAILQRLSALYGRHNLAIEIERSYLPWGRSSESQLTELARELGLAMVAGGVVTHARREQFAGQDTALCIHTLCLIEEVLGRKEPRSPTQPAIPRAPERSINGERFLRTAKEMAALFSDRPELLEASLAIADQCEADVLPGLLELPNLYGDDDKALRDIVSMESHRTYPQLTRRHRSRIQLELSRIITQGFASHFVLAWDLVRFAKERNIHLSGRGSVVDSAVAYVLGLSRIDAIEHRLHFDRFLPADGTKRPDIDIDFEAKHRDTVRGYLVGKYGVEHVAAVAAYGAFNTRGIVREVGKVFGIPQDAISYLAKRIHGGVSPDRFEAALDARPELRDSDIPREKFRWVMRLAEALMDVPRNVRLHSSGVIVSAAPIRDCVPVMWSAAPSAESSGRDEELMRMVQWDKRSIKYFADKYDLLCLRGQDVLSGVELRVRESDPDFSAERVKATTDPEVYRAMRSGELIGVPQSASPAMRQAHMRLGTDNLHDTSLVQAGIRPGVGGAVQLNELIARRRGKPYTFEHPDLERILGITYGIIVFQEQVDQLLQNIAGYTSGEAEDIRDAIYKKRKEDYAEVIRSEVIERIRSRGYSLAVADLVYGYVAGFKGYGFAQGHALAFAEVSLRSVYLMQHHPAAYFASLLSAQPAGYYGPATICNEARGRGVSILPLDVEKSKETFAVEDVVSEGLTVPGAGIRVALTQLAGLSSGAVERILEAQSLSVPEVATRELQLLESVRSESRHSVVVAERCAAERSIPPRIRSFRSVFDFARQVQPNRDELEAIIFAGGLDSLHSNRRALLWAIPQIMDYASAGRGCSEPILPLDDPEPDLPTDVSDFNPEERAVYERTYLGLDVSQHLMAFERERVQAKGGFTSADMRRLPPGARAFAVGNPIRLRFPPTQSGKRVVFFDLEDESGLLNVTCFDDVYQRDGHAIITSQYVTVVGDVQDRDGSPAFLARRVFPYTPLIAHSCQTHLPLVAADFLVG